MANSIFLKDKDEVSEINTQLFGFFIKVFVQQNLAQKVEV